MRIDPAYQKITAEEFLAIDFGTDRRFELSNGVIQMMSGGSSTHAHVAGNIYAFLRANLRGSGCVPFNSDMALRVSATDVRYPDIAVYCGSPLFAGKRPTLSFENPTAAAKTFPVAPRRTWPIFSSSGWPLFSCERGSTAETQRTRRKRGKPSTNGHERNTNGDNAEYSR